MPTFRVIGHVRTDFVYEIEADSQDEAERKIEALGPEDLDVGNATETIVSYALELDADGNELEEEAE